MLKKIIKYLKNFLLISLKLDNVKILNKWNKIGTNENESELSINGYANYDKRKELFDGYIDNLLDSLNKNILLNKNSKILDYGCGTGRYMKILEDKYNVDIYGVDFSKTIISNFTSKKFPEDKLFCLDLTTSTDFINNYGNYFNGIYLITVLQYVRPSQINILFKIFYKILNNEGVLYINFPYPKSILDSHQTLEYTKYFPVIIEKKLKKVGFKIIESYCYYTKNKVRKVRKKNIPINAYIIVAKK